MRWLEVRHQTFYVVQDVPRQLRKALGKKRLVKSLRTRDHGLALARRHAVLAEFAAMIETARNGTTDATTLIDEGIEWRRTLTAIDRGDKSVIRAFRYAGGSPIDDPDPMAAPPNEQENARHLAENLLHERIDTLRFEEQRPSDAATLGNLAFGRASPLLMHVDDWIREGGARGPVTPRTVNQYRSDLGAFADWLNDQRRAVLIESVTPDMAARYVTAQLSDGAHRKTINRRVSALSSYWRWMMKRRITAINPWQGQALAMHRKPGEAAPKRAYTDNELARLLAGAATDEIHDLIRVGALSGMRLEEIYRLRVSDCVGGWFDIRTAKSHAGIRRVPVHPSLAEIVAKRIADKAQDGFLFHEAGELPEPGRERSMYASRRFARYRVKLGLTDKPDGARQDRIDFHSLRRWFVTTIRQAGVDQATVAAVVGHEIGNITDRVYSAGPSDAQRIACVEAAQLPAK